MITSTPEEERRSTRGITPGSAWGRAGVAARLDSRSTTRTVLTNSTGAVPPVRPASMRLTSSLQLLRGRGRRVTFGSRDVLRLVGSAYSGVPKVILRAGGASAGVGSTFGSWNVLGLVGSADFGVPEAVLRAGGVRRAVRVTFGSWNVLGLVGSADSGVPEVVLRAGGAGAGVGWMFGSWNALRLVGSADSSVPEVVLRAGDSSAGVAARARTGVTPGSA